MVDEGAPIPPNTPSQRAQLLQEARPVELPRRASSFLAHHQLSAGQLLPALCPNCGAPGVRAQAIVQKKGGASELTALDSYYCDLCADHIQKQTTIVLAYQGGTLLLSLAVATFPPLYWGQRVLPLQFFLGVLFAFLLPTLLGYFSLWKGVSASIYEISSSQATENNERIIETASAQFSETLIAHKIPLIKKLDQGENVNPHWRWATALSLLSLLWMITIHSLGTATLRIIAAGEINSVLLVDSRRETLIASSNFEDSLAGKFVTLLGGRHRLSLLREDGSLLIDEDLTIWPGKTYIVGVLPPEKCLFWEFFSSAPAGEDHFVKPLPGVGPIWELNEVVDHWFSPNSLEKNPKTAAKGTWATSGGTRRAIRLLPCK